MSNYYTQPLTSSYPYSSSPSHHHQPSPTEIQFNSNILVDNDDDDDQERHPGFDVRADFDAIGPRWIDTQAKNKSIRIGEYEPVKDHNPPSGYSAINMDSKITQEELVSVPVLGPEWSRAELYNMSKRGKSQAQAENRTRAWRAWKRDQRGIGGIPWLTRRVVVFTAFFFFVGLAITLYFTIPRAVSFTFYQPSPFSVDNTSIVFNRSPTNFSFNANLNLLADSSSNYLPVHFTSVQATLYDLDTSKQIATGQYGSHVITHAQNIPITFPVTFSYSAINDSDTTWNDMYNACEHEWPGVTRPDLKFRLEVKMSILGLVTHPTSEAQLDGITCPFQLSANSV